jgi:protein phosphatase
LDFSQIIQQSRIAKAETFLAVIESVLKVLKGENGVLGNLAVVGKLVSLKPVGATLVIGDLHGDLKSLRTILEKSRFIQKMHADRNVSLIFLGDYGDRGVHSPELYYAVLTLKLTFPAQVVLLRGNHESPADLMASPHDLPVQLERKFKKNGDALYQHLKELFSCLYNAVYVEERFLMVHGGLPANLHSLHELADADKLHPAKSFLEELLWSDPDEQVQGVLSSPRGAGKLFGKNVTTAVLQKLNAKILIRGHEPIDGGYKINHDGKVLTLFSRKGPPYFNAYGAYLQLPLAEKFENANQLVPYVHTF